MYNETNNIDKEIRDIKTWSIDKVDQSKIEAIYPSNDKADVIVKLNYENRVNEIVRDLCKTYQKLDICDGKKIFAIAKDFILDMDDLSKLI